MPYSDKRQKLLIKRNIEMPYFDKKQKLLIKRNIKMSYFEKDKKKSNEISKCRIFHKQKL